MINQCLFALANNASPSLGAFPPVDFPAVCFEWATPFLPREPERGGPPPPPPPPHEPHREGSVRPG